MGEVVMQAQCRRCGETTEWRARGRDAGEKADALVALAKADGGSLGVGLSGETKYLCAKCAPLANTQRQAA